VCTCVLSVELMCARVRVCVCACVRVWVCACVRVCVSVHMYVRACVRACVRVKESAEKRVEERERGPTPDTRHQAPATSHQHHARLRLPH
jgi:hypothetical protein